MLADGRCGERGCSEVVALQGRSEDATRANAAACTPAATGAGGDKRGASGGGESGGDERCAWRHTPNFARYSFMSASCATGEASGGVPSPSDAANRIFCSDLNGSSGFAARTSFSAATRCCLRASAYSTSTICVSGTCVSSALKKITRGIQRSWEEDRRKRRYVERLCIPPGAPLRRGGVVGG